MTILVTGGAGYIGTHTCIELIKAGYDIVVVDNFSNSKPEALERVCEITGHNIISYKTDIQNKQELEKIFSQHNIEAVIHFAGLKAVGESVQLPLTYYQTNIMSTLTLCEVMKKYDVKNLVFSSSATVYGATDQVPILEESPLNPVNPYGRTKHMIEEVLRDLVKSDNNWSIALLRYFNPVGAHESGEIGEDPTGIPNNLMPYISQVAVGKLESLQVFGADYKTVDGTGVRDYIHVVDLAQGHIKALEKIIDTNGIEAYNLGTGNGYSVLQVISAFEKVSGIKIPYSIGERRPGDAALCYADVSKAKEDLKWGARKGIEDMCQDSWRWQRKYPNGYSQKSIKIYSN
ncbi:UDP-glucose 4-epimerase GalE [Bacillus spongiae]|uniref:UDP-glucose 4-epimerase n=1 Tax=Bacillus spongiae TaxID=2683610 RepID=A0ABU8HEQ0_9BACI